MMITMTRRHTLALALAAPLLPSAVLAQEARSVVDMTMGDPNAPVKVTEYASFTCPHCANFHKTVMPQLKKNYIDTGKVFFTYREVYFDRAGLWGGMIARCAPEDRYFGIADVLYTTQGDWAHAATPEDTVQNLFRIGRQAGLTDEQMNACMSDRAFAEAMVAEYQKNSEADDITSTPSFIINGEKASNMSYEDFAARLDEELGG